VPAGGACCERTEPEEVHPAGPGAGGGSVLAWRTLVLCARAAAAIVVVNLRVLGAVAYLRSTGSAVAAESVRAMALRSAVWLALLIGLASLRPGGVR
jgi:hypothetical protein